MKPLNAISHDRNCGENYVGFKHNKQQISLFSTTGIQLESTVTEQNKVNVPHYISRLTPFRTLAIGNCSTLFTSEVIDFYLNKYY